MPKGIYKHKKGWYWSEEIKRKISIANSIAHKGKKLSKETRKKIGISRLGHIGYWKGKKLSKEHIEKMRLRKGTKATHWKGGITKHKDGYIFLYQPNHPFAIHKRYVFEHRLIMEQMLRRYLKPQERVHHINGIKNDNRKENLKLFKNISEHTKFHHL